MYTLRTQALISRAWHSVLAGIFIFFAYPAFSEDRVALVIGVGDYADLRPLSNPRNDARVMDEVLYNLGFDVDVVTDRDLDRLTRALEDFSEDATGADLALIYFAGHGMEVAGENLLFARDADASSLERLRETALPLESLVDSVLGAKAGLLLIDACRTDAFGVPVAENGRGLISFGSEVSRGFGRIGRADNLLYAFAAAPGQDALDGEGENSPFAEALTRHLGTEGLEIRSALTLVQQDVYDRTRGVQLPYVESGLPELVFAAGSSALPEREQLLLAMAEVTPEDRAAVERIATDFDMPLAPLFGALFTAGLGDTSFEERDLQLQEAAGAFARVREDLRTLSSDDQEVTLLRQEAEGQLSLGAFDAARAALTAAADIDNASRETLRDNYRARTISEAETHYLNAQTALADLRRDLAITDYEKAAALYDEVLALGGGQDIQERYAFALEGLGKTYATMGNVAAATDAFVRLLVLTRARAAADPDAPELQQNLAVSLYSLGDMYKRTGNLAKAQTKYEQSLDVMQRMVTRDPTNTLWQRDLAISYERLGDLAQVTGDLNKAQSFYGTNKEIRENLVQLNPSNTLSLFDLAIALQALGEVAHAMGNLAEGRAAFEESADIVERLLTLDPANTQWQRTLAINYVRIGIAIQGAGDMRGAQSTYEAALKLQKDNVEKDPDNTEFLLSLAIGHINLGFVFQDTSEWEKAQTEYEASLKILQDLVQSDPANTQWQKMLSGNHSRLGDVARGMGDITVAATAYNKSIEGKTSLVDLDPSNSEWQLDLSVGYSKLGAIAWHSGDFTEASAAFHQALDIQEKLVALHPENALWQSFVATSHVQIGDVAREAGDLASAQASYVKGIEIRKKLADSDPENVDWQWRLALTHYKLSVVGDDRLPQLKSALAIAEDLNAKGVLTSEQIGNLNFFRQEVGKLEQERDAGTE